MSFFGTMNISATALTAQRLRMDVISENIANANTTRTGNGGPYRRQTVLFEEMGGNQIGSFRSRLSSAMNRSQSGRGVRVSNIVEDMRPGSLVYDPAHPDANEDGYVRMPNVNIVEEMVNMISASRSYEANITSMNTTKSMLSRTLEISR
ncbi:MAG: flagellar basal body rod protein FlgC [Defluviitaleaceae bacterium]|nr:flagellar basal body rod protein FlgC [Defluviitaleaceae bacterium]